MRAYLKIVPVELYGPEGSMKVHALLDEGSTVTLIDEQVANRIGAKGRRETLRVSSSDHQKPEASSATRRARHRRSLLTPTDIAENLIA
ncbi:hypothetical protein EVAR_54771_1 [Eumeta japonica]|uniref:Peptidase A2 domain-containing protein n=1 Tax=Eumeta variegata TaxID=151549 RepID=A0A4C1YFQ4_EUMVA|nr:hypothetical protein EVAR_54771_1 [Eumeta japonica]